MAKKNRTHTVAPPKATGKGTIVIGTITVEQQLKNTRAASRAAFIAAGSPRCGAGIHGGDDATRNKRERRDARRQCRDYGRGNYDE